jgi:hypothetical protein
MYGIRTAAFASEVSFAASQEKWKRERDRDYGDREGVKPRPAESDSA